MFKFQVYQNKPSCWLHQFLLQKIYGCYLVVIFYSFCCYCVPNIKLIYILSILIYTYRSLCLSTNIWFLHNRCIILILTYIYFNLYYNTTLYLTSRFYNLFISNIFLLTQQVSILLSSSPSIILIKNIKLVFNISLYVNTIIYLVLFRILLLTLSIEELISLFPIKSSLKNQNFFSEIKFILILSVQLLNFNLQRQKEIWKLFRSRGVLDSIKFLPLFFIINFYLLDNIRKTQIVSITIYSRQTRSKIISFTNINQLENI